MVKPMQTSASRRLPVVFSAPLVLALAMGFAGCATPGMRTTRVQVDAVSNPAARDGWSYTLATTRPGRGAGTERQEEVAERLRIALSQRGMYEAPAPAADVVISFDYGEGAAKTHTRTVNQPVVVQPSVGGTIGGVPGTIGTGGYPGSGPYGSGVGVGSQVVMVPTTEFSQTSEKYLVIVARENPDSARQGGEPAREVWRVEAKIDDESVDVFNSIPALVDAVVEYMGTTTGGAQSVTVKLPH